MRGDGGKMRLRDRAEGLGVKSYNGKPLSRLNIRELYAAIHEQERLWTQLHGVPRPPTGDAER